MRPLTGRGRRGADGAHRGLGGRAAAGRPCRCADSADVDGFVAAFTGSHRYVLDYLAEEVLEQQPGPGA